jgi:hypothetical protein
LTTTAAILASIATALQNISTALTNIAAPTQLLVLGVILAAVPKFLWVSCCTIKCRKFSFVLNHFKTISFRFQNFRLSYQVPDESAFADVVDVEDGLSKNTRCLYPKVAAKAQHLDDFLNRRTQLKTLEERRFELNSKTSVKSDAENDACSKFIDDAKKNLWSMIAKLKEASVLTTTTTATNDVALTATSRPDHLLCYSPTCRKSTSLECYSVACRKNKKETPAAADAAPAPSVVISNPAIQEASNLLNSLIKEAANHGLEISSETSFPTRESAVAALQNLVKILMQKKEEAASKVVVNGNAAADDKDPAAEDKKPPECRIYSSSDASGKLYLKRIQSVGDTKPKSKEIKYPLAPSFHSRCQSYKTFPG